MPNDTEKPKVGRGGLHSGYFGRKNNSIDRIVRIYWQYSCICAPMRDTMCRRRPTGSKNK